jgi:hypothetical protein
MVELRSSIERKSTIGEAGAESGSQQAGGGTRTRGRRFTKPVLYQLSYSGYKRTD